MKTKIYSTISEIEKSHNQAMKTANITLAAPEMLEALKDLQIYLDNTLCFVDSLSIKKEGWRLFDIARKATDKAEGK